MRRHELGTVKNPDELILDDDLDVIAHESMRHAVPDGVDVHEGVERHAAAQALCPPRQRAERQRPEGRALVSLEAHDRRLTCRPVASLVSQRHPLGQVLLERAEGVEALIRQRIALDVFDAASVLPLVRARYGAHARGWTSQSRQKAR